MPLDFVIERKGHYIRNYDRVREIVTSNTHQTVEIRHKVTKNKFTCKSMPFLNKYHVENIQLEVSLFSSIDHVSIPKLVEFATSSDHIYLVK